MYNSNFKYRNSYKWLFATPEYSNFLRCASPYLSEIEQFSNKSREISTNNTRQYRIDNTKYCKESWDCIIEQIKQYQATIKI